MRRQTIRPALLALLFSIAGPLAAEEQDAPVTLVKIDDFAVTNLHLALFGSQTGRQPQDPGGQIDLLNELVNNFMVANSDAGRALAQKPEVAAALEVARARLVAQTFIRTALQEAEISDAQIRERYDSEYAKATTTEYKARHILLDSEGDARSVITALDDGGDFATLASERSTGPSKSVGGDLGWFEAGQMVPAFSAATAALADGRYTPDPVKTRFGWHVILREDSRELPPPALDAVRAEIERELKQEYVADAIAEIQRQARIEVQRIE